MITRIEIDGFKSFENFELNLQPFTAIVGPNASGKSNLFDALKFLSLLASHDIGSAMRQLRGEPWEQFRRTPTESMQHIAFGVEITVDPTGIDGFGLAFEISAQRLRYEVKLRLAVDSQNLPQGVFLEDEQCVPILKTKDKISASEKAIRKYSGRETAFLHRDGDRLLIRQDGPGKRGRPIPLPLKEASRTALSTINTAEFPHLYALKQSLMGLQFLEINPRAARQGSDRLAERELQPDGSNLSAVLARLKESTATKDNPDGVLRDISIDLASLIPSIRDIETITDERRRDYSFFVTLNDGLELSSRIISDGTLRFLAILTILNDPTRHGTLCFEEPENGVHEGRIQSFIEFLRAATRPLERSEQTFFQVLLNTHSPQVMSVLKDDEIVLADIVISVDPSKQQSSSRTRMRSGLTDQGDLIDPDRNLTRFEAYRLLRRPADAA